jgi:ATP-binding cassette subfamily B multidrug efflux pump
MGMGALLREDIFEHASAFSLHEFDKIGTPSLVTRTTNDVVQVQMVVLMMMRMMISAPIMMIGGIIMAVSKDKGLAWVIVAVIPALGAVIVTVAVKGFPLFRAIQKKIDRINLVLREGLTGIRVIRAFNRVEDEKKRFDAANLDLMQVSVQVNRLFAVLIPVMMFIMNFTTIAIIWFGSVRVDRGTSNVGNMMAFLQYAMQILFSLLMASFMFMMVPRAQASAVRINEVLDMVPEIVDPAASRKPDERRRRATSSSSTCLSATTAPKIPALSDISFSARPGEVTAVIGSTGSGKSTLISLIPRFYDVSSGAILVDGVDVREMSQEELRARIGLVPQKAVLFSGSVGGNIRYGNEAASDAKWSRPPRRPRRPSSSPA